MFHHSRVCWLVLASLCVAGTPLAAGEGEGESALIATLNRADASVFEKSLACKRLAVIGTEAAVPALARLLDDQKLSHLARYGLEPIPSPAVDAELLAALGRLQGANLIGVINSLANRGHVPALKRLSELMTVDDENVSQAAAHAIARLGTPAAADILAKALSDQFAAACLVGGKTLADQGHYSEAARLLSAVAQFPQGPEHVRLAAMLQLVLTDQADGQQVLATTLQSDDPGTFKMALRMARLLPGKVAAPAVVTASREVSPSRTALLVALLGDLGDPSGLAPTLQAFQSQDVALRIAALEALSNLGSAAQVELLMDATIDNPEEVASQAYETLTRLRGREVDQAVLGLLDDPARRSSAIRVIGQRRIAAAVPELLVLLDGPDQLEVVAALGETVSMDELGVLAGLIHADSTSLREAAERALHAACTRMPDRDATAAELAKSLTDSTAAFVLNELRLLGGDTALEIVGRAVESDDEALKDHASQALGEWLDVSAAPVLLELARSDPEGRFGIRGMRGYVRIARQFSMPQQQRLAMCQTTFEVASRDSEKRLALGVLERYPSLEALRLAVDAAKDPALQDRARQTALAIAKKIGNSNEAQALLDQIKE